MTEYTLSPEFEIDLRAAVAVPDASNTFVAALRKELLAKTDRKMRPRSKRLHLTWAVPLAFFFVLVVVTLVIGPQRVWAAVRSLFGYLPGVGYVETDGSLRVLSESVLIERDDVSVFVEQAIADSQRTVVVYKVEGLSVQAANSEGEGARTGSVPYLQLPDGEQLNLMSGGGPGWGIGYRNRLVFPAIPADVNDLLLVIPVLQGMPHGVAPEDWEIPLHFELAPPDLTLQPVYETDATPTGSETPDSSETPESPTKSEVHGIELSLDRIVELDDGYILEGNLSWEGAADVDRTGFYEIDLFDANGQKIPAESVSPDPVQYLERSEAWALQTSSKAYPGPWVISLPEMMLHVMATVGFQIDLGYDPQLGQVWEFDQPLEVAGQPVRLTSARLYRSQDERIWLEFSFSNDTGIISFDVWDPNNSSERVSGRGSVEDDGTITAAFTYDEIPTGLHDIEIVGMMYTQDGPWTITWQPLVEAGQAPSTPVPLPEACLTLDMWEQFKNQTPTTLPDGLGGRFLILTHTGLMLPQISLIDLNGDNQQDYGTGAWISLSPDGKTIAIPKDDGVYLVDAANGEYTYLQGTNKDSGYPIWSPDGEWIAFHGWDAQSIYRLRTDGSSLERVYEGADVVYLSDWTPDGRTVVYLGFGEGGMVIQGVDVETGIREILLQTEVIKPTSRPAISPDGEWIAYQDEVFGQLTKGAYIAHLDGSGRRPLVAIDSEIGVAIGDWSPDGQWLVVNIYDWDIDQSNAIPVLVQPSTCSVYPLFHLHGEIVGWAPGE
ncbi:MAG: hypothetical protein PVF83_11045 [Anaerolineales bacterium]|jgi:WD40 repeat protein